MPLVQSASGAGSPLAFPNPVTAGNLLVAVSGADPVTDSQGNAWTLGGTAVSNWPFTIKLSYAVAGASGANSVMVGAGGLIIAEISGYELPLTVDDSGTAGAAPPPPLMASQAYDILVTAGIGTVLNGVSGTEQLFGNLTGLPSSAGSVLFAPSAGPIQSSLSLGAHDAYVSIAFKGNLPVTAGKITQSVLQFLTLQPGIAEITQSVVQTLVGLGIVCGNPPPGSIGVPYSHQFPVGSGDPPYTFAIVLGVLPSGLALDPATGIVSGTPNLAGVFPFTVQVTDSLFSVASVRCSISIPNVLGNVRITLRGVKLRPKCGGDEPQIADVPQISKVDRAL